MVFWEERQSHSTSLRGGLRRVLLIVLRSMLSLGCKKKDVGTVRVSLEQKDEEYNSISTPTQISVTVPNAEASFDKSGEEIYNNNGVRIVSKMIVANNFGYNNDMHVLLYPESNSGNTISVDHVYDSLSINGYMTDYSFSSIEIPNGGFGLVEIKLWESSLEDNKI